MKNARIRAEIQRHNLEWEDIRRALKYSHGKFHSEMTDHEMNPAMRRKVEKAIMLLSSDEDEKQIYGAFAWYEMYRHKKNDGGE